MRIRWRGFELPVRVVCEQETKTDRYAKFIAEPFERGFGTTIGNSLRRVLLSSIEGAAVTSAKIQGVQHEFSTIPGVVEDVTEIILNLKMLVIRMHGEGPKTIRIDAHKAGEVTAADIINDPDVEIINKDLHIATLSEDTDFVVEMEVNKGRGYRTAEENEKEEQEIGVIPMDSAFSPVTRVEYHVEDSRVGQRVNYDRLIMQIWTNGSVTPEMALVEASKILRKHLNPFVQYFELGREMLRPPEVAEGKLLTHYDEPIEKKLDTPIEDLELSARAYNCLHSENITTVRDLVRRTREQLLEVRNLGKTSLKEIEKKLAEMGLSLGMALPEKE